MIQECAKIKYTNLFQHTLRSCIKHFSEKNSKQLLDKILKIRLLYIPNTKYNKNSHPHYPRNHSDRLD